MIDYCTDVCLRDWQEQFLYLWVEGGNRPAVTLYKKLGFYLVKAENGPLNDASKIKLFDLLKEQEGNHMLVAANGVKVNRAREAEIHARSGRSNGDEQGRSGISRYGERYPTVWSRMGDGEVGVGTLAKYDRVLLRRDLLCDL
jgi:hypothetical protein